MRHVILTLHRLFRWALLSALCVMPTAVLLSGVMPARAAFQDAQGIAPTKKSKVAPIILPKGTLLYSNKQQIVQFTAALEKMAKGANAEIVTVEVLAWQGETEATSEIIGALKKAGYAYTSDKVMKLDQGQITPFQAVNKAKQVGTIGMWLEQGGNTMLAWASVKTDAAANAGEETSEEEPVKPKRKPAPKADAAEQEEEAKPARKPLKERADESEDTDSGRTGPVTRSVVADVKLPEGAIRGDKKQAESVATNLNSMMKKAGAGGEATADAVEMLVWQKGGVAVRKGLYAALDKAGYERTDHNPVKNENGTFLLFSAEGDTGRLFGMWVESGQAVMLAWGKVGEASANEEEAEPAKKRAEKPVKGAEEDGDAEATAGRVSLAAPAETEEAPTAQADEADTGVLADGNPALTGAVVHKYGKLMEFLLNARMTAGEKARLKKGLIKIWRSGDERTVQGVVSNAEGFAGNFGQYPKAKRDMVRRSLVLNLMLTQEKAAQGGDEIAQLSVDIYRRAHPPIMPTVPFVSVEIADAFIDAYLFVNELKSGKPAPALNKAGRDKLRREIASDFAKIGGKKRDEFISRMVEVTKIQTHWADTPDYEKLLVRADLGARLSPEERAMAAQIRQKLNSHAYAMMSGQLNAMQRDQQTIMGSAPFFNPTTNRWEKVGGIATEFGPGAAVVVPGR